MVFFIGYCKKSRIISNKKRERKTLVIILHNYMMAVIFEQFFVCFVFIVILRYHQTQDVGPVAGKSPDFSFLGSNSVELFKSCFYPVLEERCFRVDGGFPAPHEPWGLQAYPQDFVLEDLKRDILLYEKLKQSG